MGFSQRKRTNKQINGTTMIVPGSDPNLGLGGSKNFNVNITKNRFGGQPPQPEVQQPKINPYGPLPTPSASPVSPTPTPTPSITPTITITPSITVSITPSITPTTTETPTPTPTPTQSIVYILDTYSGASVAYSSRKLRSAYSGSAMRVRRSSDNTEQDIGFDGGGNLDESSLTSFVGVGNGYVTKWYDQSGNVNDLVQTTALNQPLIVSGGSIYKVNSLPSLKYSSVNQSSLLLTNTISSSSSPGWTCFATMGRDSTADLMASITNTTTVFPYASLMFSDNKIYITDTVSLGTFTYNNTGLDLITTFFGTSPAYVNGVSQSVSVSSSSAGGVFQGVGRRSSNNSNGYISELIFYLNYQTSNRVGIETNIINYYGL